MWRTKLKQLFLNSKLKRVVLKRTKKYDVAGRLVSSNFSLYWKSYAVAFAALFARGVATGATAYILKEIINNVFLGKDMMLAFIIALATAFIFLAKGLSDYLSSIMLNRIGNNMIARMQRDMFHAILHQDIRFFDRFPLGELITRMSSNAQSARQLMDLVVISLGRDIVTLISLASTMLIQSPVMSIGAVLIAPPAVIGISYLVRRIKSTARREVTSLGRMVNIVQETVQGSRILKAFGLEEKMRNRMGEAIKEVEYLSNRMALLSARTRPLMEGLGGFAIAFAVLYGGYNVIMFNHSPGEFFSFLAALLLAYEPAKRLARLNVELEGQLVGIRMMYEILDAVPEIIDGADVEEFAAETIEISFENVDFSYRTEMKVLSNVSFLAESGQVTALVGPSGAGKSTILSLLERFYDVGHGKILLNGKDIRGIKLESLRKHIALVTQDTYLFEGTIASNIADGRPEASMDEIISAARDANAHEFITALPEAYETPILQGGTNLSGGQRQRIAIARAILRKAPILLLDEATSALDTQSEAEVQDALARLMVGRTTLVIAHRLSTVRNADNICVLDGGTVKQAGSHDQLIAGGGLYAHLYALQFRDELESKTAGELQVARL